MLKLLGFIALFSFALVVSASVFLRPGGWFGLLVGVGGAALLVWLLNRKKPTA